MAVSPVGSSTASVQAPSSAANAAQSAFGLSFQSLLQIILTELTYQDPLQPLDNFQFVSQLAEFSELQQFQTLNTNISSLLTTESTTQATDLLGRTVDLTTSQTTATPVSGTVTAVSFSSGQAPMLTLMTPGGQSVPNISISQIAQVRQ
jgi:flagellar basal-body rod modification protein FlgD